MGWVAYVRYDRTFCKPQTWMFRPDGEGIRVRCNSARFGQSREEVFGVAIRYRRTAAMAPGCIFIRPLLPFGTEWTSDEHDFGEPLGVLAIVLTGCTPEVSERLGQF